MDHCIPVSSFHCRHSMCNLNSICRKLRLVPLQDRHKEFLNRLYSKQIQTSSIRSLLSRHSGQFAHQKHRSGLHWCRLAHKIRVHSTCIPICIRIQQHWCWLLSNSQHQHILGCILAPPDSTLTLIGTGIGKNSNFLRFPEDCRFHHT